MFKKTLLVGAVLAGLGMQSVQAAAIDLNSLTGGQAAFKALSEDLTSALSYKAITPAEPLGILGFDVGAELTLTKPANDDKWASAIGESSVSMLPMPKLHAHLGLPFGIDVGAVYSNLSVADISYFGGELRYSFVGGNTLLPAVSVRGTMTKMSGADHLDLDTKGLELSISKGFLMITPYAGIGQVWATSKPGATFKALPAPATLSDVDVSQSKWFVGANINMGLMNFAFETDKTGDASSYSAKVGLRF
ncbi:MAG: hypothetical protein OEW58_08055 [Gammaproteobacteria bacterium]|nr:hypothetical protein [Gammaproteobacteria bacterium]